MSRLAPKDVEIVIHHGDCPDGVGAASIVWSFNQAEGLTKVKLDSTKVKFFPAWHGREPPREIEGKNVLILDFSYSEPILRTMLTKCKNLLVLDHHKTAMKALEFLPEHQKVFDMNKSGVSLTWEYFHPGMEMPMFYRYIEDGDLWRKKLLYAEEYYTWIQTVKFDYQTYVDYASMSNEQMNRVLVDARSMLELNRVYVERALEHEWISFTRLKDKYYLVASVNTSILHSEIGNKLVTQNPLVDFAAVYSITGAGTTKYSLRSTDIQADCSIVATQFGGGGHRNASGMAVEAPTNRMPGPVYDLDLEVFKTIRVMGIDGLGAVLSLQSHSHRHMLGAYLLQTRYGNVTEGQAIEKIVRGKDTMLGRPFVAVWSYDALAGTSSIVVSFAASVSDADVQMYSEKLGLDDKRTFTIKGLPKFIDL